MVSKEAEDLLNKQQTLITWIRKFLENTKRKGTGSALIAFLQSRLKLLDDYWLKFSDRHDALLSFYNELKEHYYFANDVYIDIESVYSEYRAVLLDEISSSKAILNDQSVAELTTSSPHRVLTSFDSRSLPKLPVPKFSGRQQDWENWKELFCSIVKNDEHIPPVVKLQHLLNSVEGEAERKLRGTKIIASNLAVAWEKLTRRYDNKNIRSAKHFESIIGLEPIKRRSASELNRVLDTANEAIQGFRDLSYLVDQWDRFLVYLVARKLDRETREDWEISLEDKDDAPKYTEFSDYLEKRIQSLEQAEPERVSSNPSATSSTNQGGNKVKSSTKAVNVSQTSETHEKQSSGKKKAKPKNKSQSSIQCIRCSESHYLGQCPEFKGWSTLQRRDFVKKEKLCYNCLNPGHSISDCKSKSNCFVCQQRHHTTLHIDNTANNPDVATSTSANKPNTSQITHISFNSETEKSSFGAQASTGVVLLATAIVELRSREGHTIRARALIDPGSEASLVSEKIANSLSLPRQRNTVSILTIGDQSSVHSKGSVVLTLSSPISPTFSHSFSAIVLNKLTTQLPRETVKPHSWPHVDKLKLADPHFWKPAGIDCLLGADVYPFIIKHECRTGVSNTPMAQLTEFGWTLIGTPTNHSNPQLESSSSSFHINLVEPSISALLTKFWEIEEVSSQPVLSQDEVECDLHYQRTTKRDINGSYTVSLPFSKACSFPDSRNIAVACFLRSEKNRHKNHELNQLYTQFMDEYLELGHMEEVPASEVHIDRAYYLPHHAVFRNDESKKIRVVFNASQRASNGTSLNDCLHQGKKLQTEITSVLTNWRFFAVVFTADIVKMFRQIAVEKNDTDFQRIVWRKNLNSPIQDYRLKTVTYGTSSAPYLAIRTLHQLADDERGRFPDAAELLRKQTYVDDIFAGADKVETASKLQKELVDILNSAGIKLGKWASNNTSLLVNLSSTDGAPLEIDTSEVVSTLGLNWKPNDDYFFFKARLDPTRQEVTKRSILSEVAKLYDPMGWMSPVVIKAKILFQDLWIRSVDWDTPIPPDILETWLDWRDQLSNVADIRIPRWFKTKACSEWILHGFSDASHRAYSAALYIVAPNETPQLIISKTKVAPVKTLSIPKLELSGALLLARLVKQFLVGLTSQPHLIFCWTDSTVVLSWLGGHASRWKPFVANRVSEISTLVPQARWNHVRTSHNPADCASRGLFPHQLKTFKLWWHGPDWLSLPPQEWPVTPNLPFNDEALEEERKSVFNLQVSVQYSSHILNVLAECSTLNKVLRTILCCLKWRTLVRKNKSEPQPEFISTQQWAQAKTVLFRLVQKEHFPTELKCLKNSTKFSKLNPIGRLLPFVDEMDGLIRVGGRLQNAYLPYSEKHPIILPKSSHFTKLLVQAAHTSTLHGGAQLMLSHINRNYWILHGRRLVKSVAQNCVKCLRFAQRSPQQQMAPLPSYRLNPVIPFQKVGVDYAGPILVRSSKGRGIKPTKGYIAIFVCLVIKAVQIEVVSDLTTPTFLAAYDRLVSKRGHPEVVYSDNAKNFVGAAKELKKLFDATSRMSADVSAYTAKYGTRWSFIPPRAPHFGGLWEAAVKSFKYHFKRVVGENSYTYEELHTLTSQIEACLNSRPLCPLSAEGNDLVALTPGHFLIGKALTAPPGPSDTTDLKATYHSRWKMVQAMRNNFWYRWRKEVLQQLQQRNKWLAPVPSPVVGDVVIVKDDLTPPTQWPLGKVIAIHPGGDELNRVLVLKTNQSDALKRELHKVIPLPKDELAVAVHFTFTTNSVMAGGGQATEDF